MSAAAFAKPGNRPMFSRIALFLLTNFAVLVLASM